MGAQLRVYRRRIRSVNATKKITRAMELIAASRIVKARARVDASRPYAEELRKALSEAASSTRVDHLLLTSDRGSAGAFSSNTIKEAEALGNLLREGGTEVVTYIGGRKGASYYRFRGRPIAGEWSGFSENPTYADAREIADVLIESFRTPVEEGGVDEIHVVYTRFLSMVTQEASALRILPFDVVEEEPGAAASQEARALYNFEPSAEAVLDALLPQYVAHLIYTAMLDAAASE